MVSLDVVGSASRASRASRLAALAEILAMLALLLSYIWFWQDLFPGVRLAVVLVFVALCHISNRRHQESARVLGLRLDNWRSAARQASLPLGIAMGLPLAAGAALGTWHFEPASLPLELPWHVVWGTAQQYGLVCFFFRRSRDVLGSGRGAAFAAAGVFALLHVPNPLLIVVTFVLALVSCTLYRRVPNVFVLGVAHAAISLVLFYALPLSITHELLVGPGYFAVPTDTLHARW